MTDPNSNFIQEAITEGIGDLVSSYNEAIDKFVTDPDVRIAIKLAAGAAIMRKLLARATQGTQDPSTYTKEDQDSESNFFGKLGGLADDWGKYKF